MLLKNKQNYKYVIKYRDSAESDITKKKKKIKIKTCYKKYEIKEGCTEDMRNKGLT